MKLERSFLPDGKQWCQGGCWSITIDVRVPMRFEYVIIIVARNPALVQATVHVAQSCG